MACLAKRYSDLRIRIFCFYFFLFLFYFILFFFFNDTATTEIYTLSLHDALPIFLWSKESRDVGLQQASVSTCSLVLPLAVSESMTDGNLRSAQR